MEATRLLKPLVQRVATLQRDESLTQSKILEKETSPLAKEANQRSEAEPYETKHGQGL